MIFRVTVKSDADTDTQSRKSPMTIKSKICVTVMFLLFANTVFCADTKNHDKIMQKNSIDTLKKIAICQFQESSCLHKYCTKGKHLYMTCGPACDQQLYRCYEFYDVEDRIQEWQKEFHSSSN